MTKSSPTLSKTDFMRYLICPAYAWMAKHKPEVVPEEEDKELLDRRFAQADEIEKFAIKRYPGIREVQSFGERGAEVTRQMISEKVPAIYQATAISPEGYMAKADILVHEGDEWVLHEVKSSTGVRPKHLPDVTFQKLAFKRAGIPIKGVVIVHLNSTYIRQGGIDAAKLLAVTPADEEVAKQTKTVEKQARAAVEYLRNPTEPTTCACVKRRHNHCPTFAHFHPDVPEYSVFDVSGLGIKVLKDLVNRKQFVVKDIPEGLKLSDKGKQQVLLAKEGKPIIKKGSIKKLLDSLDHPIYFLDYETTTAALPLFDKCRPYQSMPFQFSIHVLETPDAKLAHHEFLATHETLNPVEELCSSLQKIIGPTGSVVVWNKDFEMGCNEEMARMAPKFKKFLMSVNDRVFDLMEVFSDYHYLHPDFRGSASIKKVLPVIVPELTYDELEVRGGSKASALLEDSVTSEMPQAERDKLYGHLLEYCKLDTLAMVRIYEHLVRICKNPKREYMNDPELGPVPLTSDDMSEEEKKAIDKDIAKRIASLPTSKKDPG